MCPQRVVHSLCRFLYFLFFFLFLSFRLFLHLLHYLFLHFFFFFNISFSFFFSFLLFFHISLSLFPFLSHKLFPSLFSSSPLLFDWLEGWDDVQPMSDYCRVNSSHVCLLPREDVFVLSQKMGERAFEVFC